MTVNASAPDISRRGQLRDFLVSRRGRLAPADVGIATIGRRRTPGLRREEVAMLAGVGVSWYTWLEQGREINVSAGVLDSIARALRLTEAERAHLHVLAGLRPPSTPPHSREEVPGEIKRLLTSWDPCPAILNDRYWNILDLNDGARATFNLGEKDRNCLVSFFTNDAYRKVYEQWHRVAPDLVASFRADTADLIEDPEVVGLVSHLTHVSPEFAALWARHDVGKHSHTIKAVQDDVLGRREFESTTLVVADRPEWHLVLYNARPVASVSDGATVDVAAGRMTG